MAASVPRSVRSARLSHLRLDTVIGMRSIALPQGGFQVFDVIMQPEIDFLRTKNYLAAPAMNATLQQGAINAPYVLKDIKQIEVSDTEANAVGIATDYFRKEFKLAT